MKVSDLGAIHTPPYIQTPPYLQTPSTQMCMPPLCSKVGTIVSTVELWEL